MSAPNDRMLPAAGESDPIREATRSFADSDRANLEERIATLERENRRLQFEADEAKRVLAPIRNQFESWYNALRVLFGQLDAAGVNGESVAAPAGPRSTVSQAPGRSAHQQEVWEEWKMRLPGCAKVIDALLKTPGLSTKQLAIATGLHRTTIPNKIYDLNKAGLLTKNGGHFSLKEF